METTKNKMPIYAFNFFDKLSNYLDTKLYFFGSIQRYDYFPTASDIDVDIFTDNINNTILKLQNFLHIEKKNFKKVLWRLKKTGELVEGYKVMYKEVDKNFVVEFSIYDEKYKKDILFEHNSKKELPFYATILLIILKFLYYTLGIIPGIWYKNGKRFILHTLLGEPEDEFLVIDIDTNIKK